MSMYLAIDVGGTSIKFGLVSDEFELVEESSIKTQDQAENADQIIQNLIEATSNFIKSQGHTKDDIKAVGLGAPGTILNKTGVYEFAGNLPFYKYPLREKLAEFYPCPIYFGNDANFAALAESRLGAGNNAENSVTLTLGTGMGVGVVINNRVYSGFNETGCEFGHTVMVIDGVPCTCGRKGCFESYVSATALVRQTKEAIEHYPDSILAKIAVKEGRISGRTSFNAWRQGCPVAEEVVMTYTRYLALGIANVNNSYMPEVVIIGGGISNEGQVLIDLCKDLAIQESFLHGDVEAPRIVLAALGNKAGILGAALFAADCLEDRLTFK